MSKGPQVTFWTVNDNKGKMETLCWLVRDAFAKTRRVLIAVPNDAAARFVDELLWSSPPESFIPHTISHTPIAAAIVITTSGQNLNNAHLLVNLCPLASSIAAEFQEVHELIDRTHADKEALSMERLDVYRKSEYLVHFSDCSLILRS